MPTDGKKGLWEIPFIEFYVTCVVFLVSLFIIQPFGMADRHGNFPLNDDWVYAKDAFLTLARGKYFTTGFESAWAIPQVLLGTLAAWIFGPTHTVLRAVGIALSVACLFFLNLLIKRRLPDPRHRMFVLLSFLYFTPTLYLVNSFMTDLPFMLIWLMACVTLERAYEHQSVRMLTLGSVIGWMCFIQRQFGVFIPLALGGVALIDLWNNRKSGPIKWPLMAIGACSLQLVGMVGAYLWWKAHSHAPDPSVALQLDLRTLVRNYHTTVMYLAWAILLVLPFVSWNWPPRTGKRWMVALTWGVVAYFVLRPLIRGVKSKWMPYVDNLVSKFGFFSENLVLFGERPIVLGPVLSPLITLVLTVGSGVLVLAVLSSLHNTQNLFHPRHWAQKQYGRITFLACLFYFFFVASRFPVFDRYLVPLIPLALFACTARPLVISVPRMALSGAGMILIFTFSTTLVSDYFRWNEAKWAAGEYALAHQNELQRPAPLTSDQIHAGYEWHGMFYVAPRSHPPQSPIGYPVAVTFSPVPGFSIWKTFPYATFWSPRERQMYLLFNESRQILNGAMPVP